jgi:NAD(P)-dependent dehydrogenase (short-subunit alcohol dehydrogenase family)
MTSLRGKVAVVAGATRGCGRAIAIELGALGATVYAAGRTTRDRSSPMGRPETIEETAELVTAAGGKGVPVRVDFTVRADVDALRERLESDLDGRLDVLVNDVWGGDPLHRFGIPYWESDLDDVLAMVHNGVDSHLVSLHRLLPLLTARPGGLVVQVTDGDDETYQGAGLSYYLVKASMRAMARALAGELEPSGCAGLAVAPGFIRSEAMLEQFGVTEETWRDVATSGTDPHFVMSETPHYLGRGVAALAADAKVARFAGQTLSSWRLMHEYGFTDIDGSRPDWGRWMAEVVVTGRDPAAVDAGAYR